MPTGVMQIIMFVVQYGLPALEKIIAIVYQKTEPTKEQWDAIFALANKSYDDYVKSQPPV